MRAEGQRVSPARKRHVRDILVLNLLHIEANSGNGCNLAKGTTKKPQNHSELSSRQAPAGPTASTTERKRKKKPPRAAHHFAEHEFVQDCCLSGSVQSNHQNSHLGHVPSQTNRRRPRGEGEFFSGRRRQKRMKKKGFFRGSKKKGGISDNPR